MAILRTIWDEVQTRIEKDEKFKRFFSLLDNSVETKSITTPYFRMGIGIVGPSEDAAIAGDPPFFGLNLHIKLVIIVFHDDPFLVYEQFLKGVEIFYNAMLKKDTTFGNKLMKVPEVTFDEIGPIENSTGSAIQGEGEMILNIQKFLGGTL